MEIRICPALATKPHTVGASNPRFNASRKYGEGSDLFCPDERLNIAQLNGTHQLALNLFCVERPQLLMLTLDSQKRQYETLNLDDMKVMLEVLRRFPSFYVIFNCGRKGGCSRVHKHMQGLRGPPYAFDLVTSALTTTPFQRFVQVFEHEQGFIGTPASNIFSVYGEFIDECRKMLDIRDQEPCPHNVVMWQNSLIVIPRRKGSHNRASANAGGMMGSVWVSSDEDLGVWTKAGVANVLQELGVPNPASNMKG
jgi:ATP adenylyltransferase/5',5'''-P-1,P-4-tetraphosphate phosphorylase II